MLQDANSDIKERFDISILQKNLLKALVFLLPLAVFPFPWDWTERAMSLLILSVSTVILGLEIVKLLWDGKVSILKSSMDIGFFLILLSLLLSTIFSVDMNTSIWGIDGRLGNGLIVFVAILLLAIVSRSFIKGEKDVRSLILFFLMGFFVNNFLSLLSFFGVNMWGIIPVYRDLFQSGLPLLRSSRVHLLVNFVNIILCIGFIGEYFIDGKKQLEFFFSLMFGFLSVFNIWIYSINQGLGITLVFPLFLLILVFFALKYLKLDKETSKQIFFFTLIISLLIAIPIVLFQIPNAREAILPEDFETVTELSLGFDISWVITGSVIVSGLIGGILGLGLGTYSVAYNMFKPLDFGLLALGDSTFHTAGNEVLTKIANAGLLWAFLWFFVGFLIVKSIIEDLKGSSAIVDKVNGWRFLIVDAVILTIFLASFLFSYSVLVIFLLLIFVSLRSVIREYMKTSMGEKFLLKFWALDMSSTAKGKSSLYSFNVFLTVIVSCLVLGFLVLLGLKTVASLHVLRAEAFLVRENSKYSVDTGVSPTLDERENFLISMDNYYMRAVNLDRNNPVYIRKRALMLLERIGVLVERFSQIEEEDTESRDKLLDEIMVLKPQVIELGRRSTDISSSIYANWATRSTIYTGLIGVGFNEHISDAIVSLERSISLNPLNFQLYFSLAQVNIVKGDTESAMNLLSRVLEINPQHVPSILLMADLYKEEGDMDMYVTYLQAAKEILENEGATELEMYTDIVEALENPELEGIDLKGEPDIGLEEEEGEEEVQEDELILD